MRSLLLAAILCPLPTVSSASPNKVPKIAAPPEVDQDVFGQFVQDVQSGTAAQETLKTAAPGSPEEKTARTALANSQNKVASFADKYPNSVNANMMAGQALNKLGGYDKVPAIADRAVELGKKKGDERLVSKALVMRAEARFQMKDYEAAVKDAEAALKADPRNLAARELKFNASARVEGGAGASKSAAAPAADTGGAASNAAEPASASRSAAGAWTRGSAAPIPSDPALTAAGDRYKAKELLKEAAQRAKIDPASALPLADKAVALTPADPAAYEGRAAARRAAGDLAGALEDLDRSLALLPDSTSAHAAKASALVALKAPAEEVEREFLAAGRAPSEFAGYYRDQVAALADADGHAAASGAPAPDRSWTAASLPAAVRRNSGKLMAVGLGLVLFGLALQFQTRKRVGDGRRDS